MTKFREGTRSLGAVVKELMASRDAHWLPHVVSDNQSVAAPVVTPNPAGAAAKPASESKFLPGPVIDCEMHMVCEGDALAGLVFESGRPPARTKKKRQAGASGQVRRVLAAVAALPPTVGAVIPYWSQEG